jgi:hypothetical protein
LHKSLALFVFAISLLTASFSASAQDKTSPPAANPSAQIANQNLSSRIEQLTTQIKAINEANDNRKRELESLQTELKKEIEASGQQVGLRMSTIESKVAKLEEKSFDYIAFAGLLVAFGSFVYTIVTSRRDKAAAARIRTEDAANAANIRAADAANAFVAGYEERRSTYAAVRGYFRSPQDLNDPVKRNAATGLGDWFNTLGDAWRGQRANPQILRDENLKDAATTFLNEFDQARNQLNTGGHGAAGVVAELDASRQSWNGLQWIVTNA